MRNRFWIAGVSLAALFTIGDAHAQTFPAPATNTTPFWIPITRGGNSISDPANASADNRDIVGDATHSAAYVASDANFLYLRLRLNGSPGTVANIANNHGYGCLIDTDGTLATYELALILDGNGTDAIKFDWNSTAGANSSANPAETNLATVTSTATNTKISTPTDGSNFSANADAFLDFAFSWTTFRTKVGASPTITSATALRFICGTSVLATNANELENDIFDNGTGLVLSTSWSDAYTCNNGGNPRCVTATDPDGDGLQTSEEATLGTTSTNFDSDGDGIPDLYEAQPATPTGDIPATKIDTDNDGTSDALDTDSDNDCVLDSVEGLAGYRIATKPNAVANANCTSATKPLCDQTSGTCSACNGDNGSGQPLACPATTAPICQASGACTVCSPSEFASCSGMTPACESSTGQCAACNGDHGTGTSAVCPTTTSPACNTTGANVGTCTECNQTNLGLCPPQSPSCAEDTGACAACTGDNGATTNAPCPTTATPACNLAGAFGGRCTVCSATNTTLCPAAKPACDPGGGVCTKCDGDRGTGSALQCPNADAPLCVLAGTAQGSCIKCLTSADCGSGHAGPTCDPTSGECVDVDTDHDGLQDAIEILLGTNPNNPDSDGDGILDPVEVTPVGGGAFSKVDTDNDGTIDALDTDSDNDTLLDADESGLIGDAGTLRDTDGDGTPDYRDIDDDNDQIGTIAEIQDTASSNVSDDVDGDGLKNWVDSDANGNGVKDGSDGRGDNDHDGILNYLDLTPDGGPVATDAGSSSSSSSSSTSSSSGFVITPAGDAGTPTNGAAPEDGVVEGSGGCNSSGGPISSLLLAAGVVALALVSRRRRR